MGNVQVRLPVHVNDGDELLTEPNVRPVPTVSVMENCASSGALSTFTLTVYVIVLPMATDEPGTGTELLVTETMGFATTVCAVAVLGAGCPAVSLVAAIVVVIGIGPGLVGATT